LIVIESSGSLIRRVFSRSVDWEIVVILMKRSKWYYRLKSRFIERSESSMKSTRLKTLRVPLLMMSSLSSYIW